jgi:hypothetical protein
MTGMGQVATVRDACPGGFALPASGQFINRGLGKSAVIGVTANRLGLVDATPRATS